VHLTYMTNQRICMVTGANRGIGKATALKLAQTDCQVVLVCRDRERGEQARKEIIKQTGNPRVDLLTADLSVQASTRQLAETFLSNYERLDVLINNHTAIFEQRELSADGIEMNFAVNYLSYFHLTNLLLNTLIASEDGRVVTVAAEVHRSGTINFDDLFFEQDYNAVAAFCRAKLGNVLFTYELARRMEGTTVVANCLHPGSIDTLALRNMRAVHSKLTGRNLADYPAVGTVEEGAQTPFYLATSEEVKGVTGKYFIGQEAVSSSDESNNPDIAQHLWQVSAEMVGLLAS